MNRSQLVDGDPHPTLPNLAAAAARLRAAGAPIDALLQVVTLNEAHDHVAGCFHLRSTTQRPGLPPGTPMTPVRAASVLAAPARYTCSCWAFGVEDLDPVLAHAFSTSALLHVPPTLDHLGFQIRHHNELQSIARTGLQVGPMGAPAADLRDWCQQYLDTWLDAALPPFQEAAILLVKSLWRDQYLKSERYMNSLLDLYTILVDASRDTATAQVDRRARRELGRWYKTMLPAEDVAWQAYRWVICTSRLMVPSNKQAGYEAAAATFGLRCTTSSVMLLPEPVVATLGREINLLDCGPPLPSDTSDLAASILALMVSGLDPRDALDAARLVAA